MFSIKNFIGVIAILVISYPFHSFANQTVALTAIIKKSEIERAIDNWLKSTQIYLSIISKREVSVTFEKTAKTFLISKYEKIDVPTKFRDEKKFPFFTVVVIKDIEKVTWKSYRYSIKRAYTSYLNFFSQLGKKFPIKIAIIMEDVKKALDFWDCNAFPQPPPPKCPPNCVENTYKKTLEHYRD